MEPGLRGPSRTAMMTAVGRGYHREGPEPHVLDDWLAFDLAGNEGRAILENMRTNLGPDRAVSFGRWVAVRSRFVEDMVEAAADDGIGQYVLLGAGLDSFAYRRNDMHARIQVFEVDHPDSQAWKRLRVGELGIELPPNLVFAPVNFETQTLRDGLSSSGFDFALPAIFSWIGVTMYLTREAIDSTLRVIAACAAGTRVVLTYDVPRHTLDQMGQLDFDQISGRAAAVGEPFVSLFEPHEIEELLQELGFQGVRHFGPDEAVRTYFSGHDVRFAGVQRLVAASIETPTLPSSDVAGAGS